jgi:hypothetical protein
MTVRDIMTEWLRDHGYDGLCGEGCGCTLDNLMICDCEDALRCVPGYKILCPPDHATCPIRGTCDMDDCEDMIFILGGKR